MKFAKIEKQIELSKKANHPKKDDTKIKIDFEVKNMENLYLAKNTDYDILKKKYEKCKKISDEIIEDNEKLKEEMRYSI